MEKRGYNYNDYELLYLIALGSEEALQVMFKKYEGLIGSRIIKYRIEPKMRDDFFQEGLIILYKTIKLFREDKKMSFTNFFDLLLNHHYIDLLRKNYRYYYQNILTDNLDYIVQESDINKNVDLLATDKLSLFEHEIWNMRYEQKKSVKEISELLGLSVKQIYSAIARIKQKNKIKK